MDKNSNKLDIYKYFASPDVALYCRNKGKTFTPLEMAVIINDSPCPIYQKHEAYRILISEYEDMQVESPQSELPGLKVSLHHALTHIIDEEQRRIDDFLSEKPYAVFQSAVESGNKFTEKIDENTERMFSSFQYAVDDLNREYSDKNDGIERAYKVYKFFVDDVRFEEYSVDLKGNILFDHGIALLCGKNSWLGFLSDFFVDVPVPFRRGNIVEYVGTLGTEIDVFDCLERGNPELCRYTNFEVWAQVFSGRFAKIDSFAKIDYKNFKFSRGELPESKMILKHLSDYLQDAIELLEFLEKLDELSKKYGRADGIQFYGVKLKCDSDD